MCIRDSTGPTSCDRGINLCKNYAKEQSEVDTGTCCSHESCDLNEVRSLAWEPSFGSNPACYGRCDDIRCYPQGIYLSCKLKAPPPSPNCTLSHSWGIALSCKDNNSLYGSQFIMQIRYISYIFAITITRTVSKRACVVQKLKR